MACFMCEQEPPAPSLNPPTRTLGPLIICGVVCPVDLLLVAITIYVHLIQPTPTNHSPPAALHSVYSTVCKYTVHERCVQRAPASCITTYVKSKKGGGGTLLHHWVEGNCYGRCSKCRKRIKSYHGISGLTCRWCHMTVSLCCAAPIESHPSLVAVDAD